MSGPFRNPSIQRRIGMCGIGGQILLNPSRGTLEKGLATLIERQRHRGPDGEGTWIDPASRIGLAHVRLSIIDLSNAAAQPMTAENGNVVCHNGELYNYRELRADIGQSLFRTTSDTEVVLRAYEKWGADCVRRFRGMFAFAIWDAKKQALFVARDRFGIKPFYFHRSPKGIVFASEMKGITPFLQEIRTSHAGLRDYFSFQFCLGGRTLFDGIEQLQPGHCGYFHLDGRIEIHKYWEVYYNLDWDHTENYFRNSVRELLLDSVDFHLRADVEVGAYLSGGVDSSLVAALARDLRRDQRFQAFNGRFVDGPAYDESQYARALTDQYDMELHVTDIGERDFVDNISRVIYHLDQPVAGPGSFPQYMVARDVRKHIKVVLGGQGGDEIFGGYTRYLLAYFEQCVKGAISGTMNSGNFVVTYESIIPNLRSLEQYKPLIQEFWREGIFDERDKRYFRLVNRSNTVGDTVRWEALDAQSPFSEFQSIYWADNVGKESYFDSMTHFDFKTLLPALLHVEDRMSMAHGIESRVPLLDHPLVELAATIPANIKFQNGELKRLLRNTFADKLPAAILGRKDKMGFPVPLAKWLNSDGQAREFVMDTFRSGRARDRFYLSPKFDAEQMIHGESQFGRNVWAFLGLELWQTQFHDVHDVRQAECLWAA